MTLRGGEYFIIRKTILKKCEEYVYTLMKKVP